MRHGSHQIGFPHSALPEPPRALSELVDAAGIRFNGRYPQDIQVHDEDVYRRILLHGSLGFGEAYMDGQWDCLALDDLFHRLLSHDIDARLGKWVQFRLLLAVLRQAIFNLQSSQRAFQVAEQHYDLGNDIFEAMLDSSMSYSCGYWKSATNLEQAQFHKLDMICRKLELQPGEQLLDIGCGWGGMARHAARHYGVHVLGITVSRQQQQLAQQRCRGLPVNIELMDYRDLKGQFDKVVSVGMFEHVGPKNYPAYFDTVNRTMKRNGLFLLHTIGSYQQQPSVNDWINKYIFPNGKLPAANEITSAIDSLFILEDWHNFGQDYDRTLMAWWENFDRAWPLLQGSYSKRFYRMWKYYLHSCAGYFRARRGQLWQLVLSKRERSGQYRSTR